MNAQFQFYKLYYKYINPSAINHYKLLLLTEEYRNIGKNYFDKYPNAQCWINMNKELFDSNKKAEMEYIEGSKKQAKIKKEFFENHEIICKNSKNKDYIVCSEFFQNYFVNHKYHYEQYTDDIIAYVMKDIRKMDLEK